MKFLFILFLLLASIFVFVFESDMNDDNLYTKLDIDSTRVLVDNFNLNNIEIRYADVGDETNRLIIFIHGAPGSLDAFNGFLKDSELRNRFRMISYDRPGYGNSDFGNPMVSISNQADFIFPLINKNKHQLKPILVGHSYGATIAAHIAMNHSDKIGGVILVGAAVDPMHERIFWVSYLADLPILKSLVPKSMRVANAEKLTHVDELKKMINGWKNIESNITIVHGKKDGLVPVENAYFMDKMVQNINKKLVLYDNIGHLIPWTNPDLMKKEIFEMVKVE